MEYLTSLPTTPEEDGNYDDYTNNTLWTNQYPCDRITDIYVYEKVILPILYLLVLLLGFTGNGLMLAVLLSCSRSTIRTTEVYLMHLALADLMLLLTLPLILISNFRGWILGDFMCKAFHVFKDLSCHSGSILLACISVDRYTAIVHAVQNLGTQRPLNMHLVCAIVWLVSLAVSVPSAAFVSVREETPNSTLQLCAFFGADIHSSNWLFVMRLITHLCFFLPLAIMSYCYSAVIVTLCQRESSREKQGAIRLAMVITIVFLLCWLPYNISLLLDTLTIWEVIGLHCKVLKLLDKVLLVSESIGYMHSCLNPLLYAFLGVKFRRDLLHLLSRSPCLKHHLRVDRLSSLFASVRAPTTSSSYI